jgi:hypothetical protein
MKEQGRAFQCEPCREIIIFFAVSDASPYIAASTVRAGDSCHAMIGSLTVVMAVPPALQRAGPASVRCGSCREDRSLPVKIANIDEPASSSNR